MWTLLTCLLIACCAAVVLADHPDCVQDASKCACVKGRPCFARGLGYCDECPEDCKKTHCCCKGAKVETCPSRAECRCTSGPCDVQGGRYCNIKKNKQSCRACRNSPERCCCDVEGPEPCIRLCPVPLLINEDCTACECPFLPILGRVYQEDGAPVGNVSLNVSGLRLASSEGDGSFSICASVGDEIVASKEGYANATIVVGSRTDFLEIQIPIGFIYITLNPTSEVRMLGDSVSFCCEATGLPSTIAYVWLKAEVVANNLLYYVKVGVGPILTINFVSYPHSGQYVCAVTNFVRYMISSQATLTVVPTGYLSCPSCTRETPLENGCTWNGLSYYYQARCRKICRIPTATTCSSPHLRARCVADYQAITIDCPNSKPSSLRVPWRCQCRQKIIALPYLYGRVRARGNRRGLANVNIWMNGELVELGKTDDNGFYNITLSPVATRYAVRFVPSLPYTEVTRIVNVPEDYRGGVRQDVRVPEAEAVTIQGGRDSKVDIPLFENEGDAVMEFPAGSFLAENYRPVEDEATVWVSTFRTDRLQDAINAPGDFLSYFNNSRQSLMSEGIFSMAFTNNNRRPLFLKRSCKFVVKPVLAMLGSPILWGLNENTGLWEFNTNLEERRDGNFEANVRLTPNVQTFNIDYRFFPAYLKVQVYQNQQSSQDDQLSGVTVQVVMFAEGSDTWSYSNSAVTGPEGACVPVPVCAGVFCEDVRLNGHITAADTDHTALFPADPDLGHATGLSTSLQDDLEYEAVDESYISSRIVTSLDGPTFISEGQCLSSTGYHYRFYTEHVDPPGKG